MHRSSSNLGVIFVTGSKFLHIYLLLMDEENNALSGSLPSNLFGKLTSLQSLHLGKLSFLFACISCSKKGCLQTMQIWGDAFLVGCRLVGGNSLSGQIPHDILQTTSLEYFNLGMYI